MKVTCCQRSFFLSLYKLDWRKSLYNSEELWLFCLSVLINCKDLLWYSMSRAFYAWLMIHVGLFFNIFTMWCFILDKVTSLKLQTLTSFDFFERCFLSVPVTIESLIIIQVPLDQVCNFVSSRGSLSGWSSFYCIF